MIIQGDNGTQVKIYIWENNEPADLTGATIKIKIKKDSKTVEKTAEITGLGVCEMTLSSDDIPISGDYLCQATLSYEGGKSFGSDIQEIKVGEKL